MNVNIASEIYHERYGLMFSFEYYMDLLKKGVELLQRNGIQQRCSSSERKAMNIALEYSNEEMMAALMSF
jgi:hypothetical protein